MKKKKSKNIIIIGGCGRIGSAMIEPLLLSDFNVIIADIDKKKSSSILNKYNDERLSFFKCDITKDSSIDKFLIESKKHFKKIDTVIFCAYPKSKEWGIEFEKIKRYHLNSDLGGHLGSAIIFSQKIIRLYLSQGYGNLIHISSIQGISAPKFSHYNGTKMTTPIEYTAMKSGIIAMTKYLAKLYLKSNIRVNCISPGGIRDDQPKSFVKKYKKDCGTKGLLDAEDIVSTVMYLISDNSKYVNGQNLVIDDGWSL